MKIIEKQIRNYDFKNPQRYSTDNMRFLSVISEDFCKYMNLHINFELKRKNITCKLEKVEQTNFQEFMDITNSGSIIVEHDIFPLVKGLIYQVDKSVVLTLIDLMLGGDGTFEDANRELTEIDKHLMLHAATTYITRLYIVDGCTKRKVSSIHTNMESSRKYSVSESVLIAHMTMYDGKKEIGKMRFCNPYCCMEPILGQLETKKLLKSTHIEGQYEFSQAIYKNICNVKAELLATLGKTKISVKDLINLNVGDVLKLETKTNEHSLLSVNGSNVYKCRTGLIENKRGLVIEDMVEKNN
ncbi:FliM/FliN family flagellar motor switch protein [Paeniclostridium sordellii]|uniref:flagellar motor switch protein FliM n=1 Tax=Paraclostridium sordellii TaxID=1505 RepID=UPI00210E6E81|nr:FliM/FliN family flagellar motor switch protein [Paeniclostridium sordellii]MCQ4698245.1 FliM/FliN family flagellar motor switch protein [Paeniclostridium sordellii]